MAVIRCPTSTGSTNISARTTGLSVTCTLTKVMGCTGVCEGDSPAFLWLVSANRGINDPDDPTQESWGGQFKKDGDKNHYVDGPGPKSISKWRKDFQTGVRGTSRLVRQTLNLGTT